MLWKYFRMLWEMGAAPGFRYGRRKNQGGRYRMKIHGTKFYKDVIGNADVEIVVTIR